MKKQVIKIAARIFEKQRIENEQRKLMKTKVAFKKINKLLAIFTKKKRMFKLLKSEMKVENYY